METQNMVYDICRHYIHDLAETHPFKATLLGFVRSRNLERLCSCRDLISDMQSIDITVFASLLQIEAFFKKNELFSDQKVCLEAAQISFKKAEMRCRRANKRLSYFYLHPDRLDPDVKLVLSRASSWISSVLGPASTFTSQIPELVRVTAGATADQSRRKSLPFLKVKRNIEVSGPATPYVNALFKWLNLGEARCKVVSRNRVEFVPKNWKTHRTIACEPTGNIPFQLAFDSYVKDRLRNRGFDLRSQSKNQQLAHRGSVDGSFATLDLTAASDTVSLNAVHLLFPKEWREFMLAFRSPLYCDPLSGKLTPYEKFSSMGNGMTFTIETLIFASVIRACGSKDGVVYGDDICVETDLSPLVIRVLKWLGFEVNQGKSFVEGPYRESCGTHWFNGTLVTPFFIRGNLALKPFMSHMVNGCASISLCRGSLWSFLKKLVLSEKLLLVPFTLDTTSGVHLDPSVASKLGYLRYNSRTHWLFLYRRYVFRTTSVMAPGIRSLLLWYHDSFRVTTESEGPRVRSRYSIPLDKFRQRKVVWHPPIQSGPDYLLEWSDFITRVSLS